MDWRYSSSSDPTPIELEPNPKTGSEILVSDIGPLTRESYASARRRHNSNRARISLCILLPATKSVSCLDLTGRFTSRLSTWDALVDRGPLFLR